MINIVYACDNNYVHYLAVALTSVCENNKNPITFYILENKINEKNKSFLKNYEKKYLNIKIIFIQCDDLNEKLNLPKFLIDGNLSMNLTTYSRLFISNLLPLNIEKVLYLDCDTLVLNSLNELWHIDIENYYCAGVDDPAPIALKNTININDDDLYVNAGVLLINLKKWRENEIHINFINFINDNNSKFFQHDQGIVNAVLNNKILKIHPKYNYLAYFYGVNDIKTVLKWNGCKYYYDEKIMIEASKNTIIKHCKPFQSPSDYKKYIELSGVKNDKLFIFEKKSDTKLGILYEIFLDNVVGRIILKIIPSFLALNLKNFVVKKQINK